MKIYENMGDIKPCSHKYLYKKQKIISEYKENNF